jgi:hypothetical protein
MSEVMKRATLLALAVSPGAFMLGAFVLHAVATHLIANELVKWQLGYAMIRNMKKEKYR